MVKYIPGRFLCIPQVLLTMALRNNSWNGTPYEYVVIINSMLAIGQCAGLFYKILNPKEQKVKNSSPQNKRAAASCDKSKTAAASRPPRPTSLHIIHQKNNHSPPKEPQLRSIYQKPAAHQNGRFTAATRMFWRAEVVGEGARGGGLLLLYCPCTQVAETPACHSVGPTKPARRQGGDSLSARYVRRMGRYIVEHVYKELCAPTLCAGFRLPV